MYKKSVRSIERELRGYYERLYIKNPDESHSYFMNNVLTSSFIYENDIALRGNNFWKVVLYTSGSEYYKNQTLVLKSILDDEKSDKNKSRPYDVSFLDRGVNNRYTDDDMYEIFYNIFTLYLNSYKHIDLNIFYKYNLDFNNYNMEELFLLNSCKLYLILFKLPMRCLFDFFIYHHGPYMSIYGTDVYVAFDVDYRKEKTVEYNNLDYLDLMMDNKELKKKITKHV